FWIDRHVGRNEIDYLAVLYAADANAALAARIVVVGGLVVGRLRIDHVQHVVFVNGDAARPAELLPGGQKFSLLVEHRDAAVATVGHIEVILAIEGDGVRRAQLPVASPAGGKGLDEFSVLGEHHDSRVVGLRLAMAFADVDVAVGGDRNTGRRIENIEAA